MKTSVVVITAATIQKVIIQLLVFRRLINRIESITKLIIKEIAKKTEMMITAV